MNMLTSWKGGVKGISKTHLLNFNGPHSNLKDLKSLSLHSFLCPDINNIQRLNCNQGRIITISSQSKYMLCDADT